MLAVVSAHDSHIDCKQVLMMMKMMMAWWVVAVLRNSNTKRNTQSLTCVLLMISLRGLFVAIKEPKHA